MTSLKDGANPNLNYSGVNPPHKGIAKVISYRGSPPHPLHILLATLFVQRNILLHGLEALVAGEAHDDLVSHAPFKGDRDEGFTCDVTGEELPLWTASFG